MIAIFVKPLSIPQTTKDNMLRKDIIRTILKLENSVAELKQVLLDNPNVEDINMTQTKKPE